MLNCVCGEKRPDQHDRHLPPREGDGPRMSPKECGLDQKADSASGALLTNALQPLATCLISLSYKTGIKTHIQPTSDCSGEAAGR